MGARSEGRRGGWRRGRGEGTGRGRSLAGALGRFRRASLRGGEGCARAGETVELVAVEVVASSSARAAFPSLSAASPKRSRNAPIDCARADATLLEASSTRPRRGNLSRALGRVNMLFSTTARYVELLAIEQARRVPQVREDARQQDADHDQLDLSPLLRSARKVAPDAEDAQLDADADNEDTRLCSSRRRTARAKITVQGGARAVRPEERNQPPRRRRRSGVPPLIFCHLSIAQSAGVFLKRRRPQKT